MAILVIKGHFMTIYGPPCIPEIILSEWTRKVNISYKWSLVGALLKIVILQGLGVAQAAVTEHWP